MKVNQNIVLTASTLRKASRIAERIEKRTTTFNEANAADAAAFLELTGQTFGAQVTAATTATSSGKSKGKRVMSQATKDKIAAGQAKRWANQKTAPTTPAPVASTPVSAPTAPVAAK
jgi:hypothetical protein